MAVYDWTPTHWDGVSLTGAPFSSASFDPANGPGQGAQREPVEARVVGRGDRFVRSQPIGSDWDIHVFLATAQQADWDTLHKTFRPEKGHVYLRANDGNGTAYRVAAACRNIERLDALHFLIRARVADPVFEENAVDSDNGTGSGGADSLTIAADVAGNQPCLPAITITPASVRSPVPTNSWHYSLRGIIANRSPRALRRYPVQLFSNSDGGDAFDTAARVAAGQMQADGDDLRVWLNGEQVERWIDGVNTTTTRLWVLVDAPARVKLTLPANITAGSPADGGDLSVVEDISRLPEQGFVVIEDEAISYQSRDLAARKLKTVERGAYGTTAAAHTTAKPIYRGDYEYVIGIGNPGASAPESSATRRPAVQLKASGPNKLCYGDGADDASTVFYDAAVPDRAAMFHPDHERDATDVADPMLLDTSTTKAAWKDSAAAAGKEQVSRLVLDLPVPIEPVASAITYDCQQRRDVRMRIIGRDALGNEFVLADKHDVDEGALTAQTITPVARLYQLILEAIRAPTTGNAAPSGSAFGSNFNAVGEGFAIKFTLDQDTLIKALLLDLWQTTGADDWSFAVQILANDGATIEAGTVLWDSGDIAYTTLTETGTNVVAQYESVAVNALLVAGAYVLKVVVSVYVSGNGLYTHLVWPTKQITQWAYRTAGSWVPMLGGGTGPYFRIVHDGAGPVQEEAALLNADAEANFDKLILALDDGSDPLVPLIRRQAAFGVTLYYCDAVITNSQNSEQLAIEAWLPLAQPFAIDCDARTVTWKEGNTQRSLANAVTPLNADAYYRLEPGAQNVIYTEENMSSTAVVIDHRGRAS